MSKKQRKSIRNKLFLPFAAVLIATVVGFAIALIVVLVYSYSETMKDTQIELTSQIVSKVDSFLNEMDTIAALSANNPDLLSYFSRLSETDEPGNYFEQSLIDGVDAGSILTNINGRNNIADRISVYNGKGDYISTGVLYETKERNVSELPIADWTEEARAKGIIVIGSHNDYWSDIDDPIISLIRPLSNSYGSASYGLVEVQRRFSRLEAQLSFETQKGLIMVIFDEDGGLLFASDPEWRETGDIKSAEDGTLSTSGWKVTLMYYRNALFQSYQVTFYVLIGGTLILLCVLVAVVYYISDRLSRPIRELSASLRNTDLQNIKLDFSDAGQDEVDDMQLAFKTFVDRLSQSTAIEMEARMFALQTQINPHFLYNSLAVISAAGYEQGNEEITNICARLSSMIRYAASSAYNVTLTDEIFHMRDYLQLMKMRYEDDFTYSITVNGNPGRVKSPKLILQPIVENCFKHGFKGVAPPWHIEVTANVLDSLWNVRIVDNGNGLPDNTVGEIRERLEAYKLEGVLPNLSPGGSGILNTAIRLSLTYGDDGAFSIVSLDGPDTGVEVVLGGSI